MFGGTTASEEKSYTLNSARQDDVHTPWCSNRTSTSIVLLLRGVTAPKSMSAEEGLAELLVDVEVHAFHVPPLSVTLAVILREGTVDQPVLKSYWV